MLALSQFISEEMISPPEHPLAKNFELSLAKDFQQLSPAEIRARQQRDRIPGVVKRLIPLDEGTTWEYWWCVPERLLLPEDVELLQRDRSRVEAILAKLVWLWGGCCFGNQTNRRQEHEPVHDWQQVINFVHQQGLQPDLLDIDFLPMTVSDGQDALLHSTNPQCVFVEPAHWHIEFFQLQSVDGGFELQEPKSVCSCQIWTSKPFTKHLETGEVFTRYDLWVSRPLNLTIPPWQAPLAAKRS